MELSGRERAPRGGVSMVSDSVGVESAVPATTAPSELAEATSASI